MIDAELHFILCLLNSAVSEQQKFFRLGLRPGVFTRHQNVLSWLFSYWSSHGRLPSVQLFQQKFPETASEATQTVYDAWSEALQVVLDARMFDQIKMLVDRTRKRAGKQLPMAQVLASFRAEAAQLTNFVSSTTTGLDFEKDNSALAQYRELIRQLSDSGSAALLIDSPWGTINRLVDYYLPGNFVVIAARPSLGKTWVAINWAAYLARKGISVAFFSKEMPKEQIFLRMESLLYELSYPALKKGALSPKDLRRWKTLRRESPVQAKLFIGGSYSDGGFSIETIDQYVSENKPQFVVIDGAYLLTMQVNRNWSSSDMLREISKRCKALAMDRNTVVLITTQSNRDGEDSKGATSSKLRNVFGSDGFAQDSDGLLVLNGSRGAATRVIAVEKSRDAAVGDVGIHFQLDPKPNFAETASVMSGSSMGQLVSDSVVSFAPPSK